ncbi:MAG: hydantoinase/oxoprolinase family protein, partial [Candidatus Methanofastidiosia archaeon]
MKEGSVVGFDIGGTNIKSTVLTPKGNQYVASGKIVNAPYIGLELEHIVNRLIPKSKEDISCVGIITSYPVSCGDSHKGVERLVTLFKDILPATPVFFIDFEGRMWPLEDVTSTDPARFAMSNFLGSVFLGSKVCSTCVVMDTGSTSTDILRIADNHPVTIGRDTGDIRRTLTGEMTWTGIIATPISSLA